MQPTKDSEKMQNFCGVSLEDLDFNLVEATLASIETQSLTPIIKEELKLKIQTQRLAAGKTELPKPVFKEPEKCELTPEEEKKRDHRRERNRIAAAKCRNKRKSVSANMKTSQAEEELKNYTLKRKIEELEKEKDELIKKLKLQQVFISHPPANIPSPSAQQTPASPSPSPLPSPSPTSLPLQIEEFTYMPSTSSGIFNTPIPRRYSEDICRNIGSLNYQPRRFSADSRDYFCHYSTQQQTETVTMATAQTGIEPNSSMTIDTFNHNFTEPISEGQEIDILSDEEFFRFENETVPFDQYRSVMPPTINLPPYDYSGSVVQADGVKHLINDNEEKLDLEEKHSFDRYLVPLIPDFEDEAMVPEGNEADRFAIRPGPTSPTFY